MNEQEIFDNLKSAVRQYRYTIQGKWLNDIQWEAVPVTFKETLPGHIAGMYSCGKIVLLHADISTIFPIYVHELRHRWQWQNNPLKYLVGKILLFRRLIENDADREQQKADDWYCGYMDKLRSAKKGNQTA